MHCDYIKATTLANSNPPLLLGDYDRIEASVSKEFRYYLIGVTCLLAKDKGFQLDYLNGWLTQAQIAQNSGYARNTMKRFICYARAIISLQHVLPELSAGVLAGKIKLGLKATIRLAKLAPENIKAIMARLETEDISAYTLLAEHEKKRQGVHNRNSTGRISPKSVKDTPRHDPDAQVAVLSYTIPSWIKAISRLHTDEKLGEVSLLARKKLKSELANLKGIIDALNELILEV